MFGRRISAFIIGTALLGTAAVATPGMAADTYKVDPLHSAVHFQVDHLGWSNLIGRFDKIDGTFVLDEANPGNSSVEIVIDAASIDTNYEKRDNDLRSPRFFNVEEFETLTFKSTGIERKGETMGTMTGDLTMLGVTRPVNVDFVWHKPTPAPWNKDEFHTGFSAQFVIKRTEWGMTTWIPSIGDEVTLYIEVEAIRQ